MAGNVVSKIDEGVRVRNVLVSVSDKSGLDTLIPGLVKSCPDVRILSTGGTFAAIAGILGLVKTLDFKIYLGLLTETYNDAHQGDLARTHGVAIDMVVCNLYPFAKTIARDGVTVEEARANIDIGGPCMVRASAKNYIRVASVVDPADYGRIVEELAANGGRLGLALRFDLARKAFAHTAAFDTAIAGFFRDSSDGTVAGCYDFQDR